MTAGITWLSERFADEDNFCLTFTRGGDESALLAAFGTDPGQMVSRTRLEADEASSSPAHGYGPFVRVGRSGEWLFAWEETSWEGVRPEVLRRASPGGEAVAVANAMASHATFAYAEKQNLVTALSTIVPYTRQGSEPDRFLPLVRQAGLIFPPEGDDQDRLTSLRAVLTIAERAFGLSLTEEVIEGQLQCARILPLLPGLPPPPDPRRNGLRPVGDPLIDLLLARANAATLNRAVANQVRGLLADSGLGQYGELAAPVEATLRGDGSGVEDEDPAGLVLRTIARQVYEAQQDSYPARRNLTADERRERLMRGQAAQAVQRVLTWSPRPALPAIVQCRRKWWPPAWREQFLDDLADVEISAAERIDAERRQNAEPGEGRR